jgi:hypothetical protein
MSDNELDNLFKEAVADFESPQDATAWKQMSAKLDQHAAQPAGFWNWKRLISFTAVGLLVTSALWYATDKHFAVTTVEPAITNDLLTPSKQAEDKNLRTTPFVKTEAVATLNANKDDHVESEKDDAQHSTSNTQSEATLRTFIPTSGHEYLKQNSIAMEPAAITRVTTDQSPQQKQDESEVLQEKTQGYGNPLPHSPHSVVQVDSVVAKRADLMITLPPSDSLHNAGIAKEDSKSKTKDGSGISVKLAVSPDFSSINFSSSDKSGINYGALVGYTFNNRWSVFTGIISSKKIYTTTEVEKSYASGGHTYPIEKLDGDCRILDIPVNVYYNFFPECSFSLKAGVGFSSYVMVKETYVYCVDYYGTDTYYEQSVKGKNNEWFKVLNLSITVEKRLTNRLSAEVEPFVKVPLAGIGEGKVPLFSLGAFVNVKYNLFKKP